MIDDDLVRNGEFVFEGTPISEPGVEQLDQVRPSIFVLAEGFNPVQETERAVRVSLSPTREQAEERIFNAFQEEIFGSPNPLFP